MINGDLPTYLFSDGDRCFKNMCFYAGASFLKRLDYSNTINVA